MSVEMRGVTKRFGALIANDAIDLDADRGSIHAIVGENGAGKTTLMRMLYGVYQPDAGEIRIQGKAAKFKNPNDAIRSGVGMVSQHYSIIPELSVLDNLILGAEMAGPTGALKRREAAVRADELARKMGFDFDWRLPASELTPAACQKLEILKLLWRNADILILDEPTAMLSPADASALFDNLRILSQDGSRTVLFVTHKLQEVLDHAHRVTVLRAGRKVADALVAQTNRAQLTRWIVGEDVHPDEERVRPSAHPKPTSLLTVSEVSIRGDRGDVAVNRATFDVKSGEIVGIAGVDGNGQSELVEALAGFRTTTEGSILIADHDVTRLRTQARMAMGLRYLPEDRHRRAVIEDWSIAENVALGFQRDPRLNAGPFLNTAAVAVRAKEQVAAFNVRAECIAASVRSLSGGNQQRLVVARTLYGDPKLLVASQPTRGLDIRGAEQVYSAIRERCAAGMAALVVSFDLDELLELCHRVLVMYRGRVTQVPEMTRESIGALMVGSA